MMEIYDNGYLTEQEKETLSTQELIHPQRLTSSRVQNLPSRKALDLPLERQA